VTNGDNKAQANDQTTTSCINGDAPTNGDSERNYWLLKAEPESRFENGVDVRFSIDDLAARTEPEPWDGMRDTGQHEHPSQKRHV
jgi:hypothetical protein